MLMSILSFVSIFRTLYVLQEQSSHQKSVKGKYRSKNESSLKKSSPLYMGMSADGLWSDILEFAKIKYQVCKWSIFDCFVLLFVLPLFPNTVMHTFDHFYL